MPNETMTCPRPGCSATVGVIRIQGGGARRTSSGHVNPAVRLPKPHYIPGTKDWCPQGEQSRRKPR